MSRHHRYKADVGVDVTSLQRSMAGLKAAIGKDSKRIDTRINQSYKKIDALTSDIVEIESQLADLNQLLDLKDDISYLLDQREKMIYWLMLLSWIIISLGSYIIFKNI
jgi:flagellar hook-associated protein FlgK